MSAIIAQHRWLCRSCDEQFDSKGKRDAHHRKKHQTIVIAKSVSHQQYRIVRSTTQKFDCSCGREFSHVQSLQRHTKSCNGWILAVESVNDNSEHEEGTCKSTEQ
jgi:hypothetical protein